MLKVNIVILNYQGRTLLEKYLPSVIKAAQTSIYPCVVTVLDNRSKDDSVEYVRHNYPEVKLVVADENKMLCSYNDLARNVREDILILLNNDIRPEPDFVDPLARVFEKHKDALFVSTYGDSSSACLRWGILSADIRYPGYENNLDKPGYTLNTGVGAFNRQKLIELDGYDELYLPGRYEDVDLCFRGWKRGWKGYYEPKSRVFHEGGASFNKYLRQKTIERLVFRNSLLFMIKNITDPMLFAQFVLWAPIRLLSFLLRLKFHMILGWYDALKKLPQALRLRKRPFKQFMIRDKTVIRMINDCTVNYRGSNAPK